MFDRLIHAALFTPMKWGWGLPLLFWGQPGIGKTSVIESYAERCGLPCRVLSPGTDGEGAFGVVPVPQDGVLTFPPPAWTAAMQNGGLVFVDEATSAPPILQASIMGLLTARRIGAHVFGPRVRVMGACNPPEIAANGFDLSSPLGNRFGHIDTEPPTVEEHRAYMLRSADGGDEAPIDARAEEARVMLAFPEAFAYAIGLESAFLAAKGAAFKNNPTGAKLTATGREQATTARRGKGPRAWPSDRSWEYAVRAFASAEVHGLSALERDQLIAGFVGPEVAESFTIFVEELDLPSIPDLLDGKVSWKADSTRLDKTAAVFTSACALVTPPNATNRESRAKAFWELLEKNQQGALDLVAPCVEALVGAKLFTGPHTKNLLAKVYPLIKAGK